MKTDGIKKYFWTNENKPILGNWLVLIGVILVGVFLANNMLGNKGAENGNAVLDIELPQPQVQLEVPAVKEEAAQEEIAVDDNEAQLNAELEKLRAELNMPEAPEVKPAETVKLNDFTQQLSMAETQQIQTEPQTVQQIERKSSMIITDDYKLPQKSLVYDTTQKAKFSFNSVAGVSAGTALTGILDSGCISSGGKCPVKFTVTKNYLVNQRVVIPAGASFLGHGVADFTIRKIKITLEKLVIGDREIDISAHLIDGKTRQPGFCHRYIDRTLSTIWKSAIMNFASGYLQAYKKPGYYVDPNGNQFPITENLQTNAALDGGSNALNNFSNKLTNDAARMGVVIIVNPGTPAVVYLDAKIPYSHLGVN